MDDRAPLSEQRRRARHRSRCRHFLLRASQEPDRRGPPWHDLVGYLSPSMEEESRRRQRGKQRQVETVITGSSDGPRVRVRDPGRRRGRRLRGARVRPPRRLLPRRALHHLRRDGILRRLLLLLLPLSLIPLPRKKREKTCVLTA